MVLRVKKRPGKEKEDVLKAAGEQDNTDDWDPYYNNRVRVPSVCVCVKCVCVCVCVYVCVWAKGPKMNENEWCLLVRGLRSTRLPVSCSVRVSVCVRPVPLCPYAGASAYACVCVRVFVYVIRRRE